MVVLFFYLGYCVIGMGLELGLIYLNVYCIVVWLFIGRFRFVVFDFNLNDSLGIMVFKSVLLLEIWCCDDFLFNWLNIFVDVFYWVFRYIEM